MQYCGYNARQQHLHSERGFKVRRDTVCLVQALAGRCYNLQVDYPKLSMASSWTTQEFTDIPSAVLQAKESVKIEQKRVQLTVGSETLGVFYQEVKPSGDVATRQVPLLLLHGMAFSSQTWNELGTLALAAASGFRAVAVDLPGYGKTEGSRDGEMNAEFLKQLTQTLNLDRPIIVSPSMSGSFSLPYLVEDIGKAATKARGYIPVAPVGTGGFTPEAYAKVTIPVLNVYGSKDNSPGKIGRASNESFKNLPKASSRDCCFEDAGHACYMNNPDLWHKVLYNFLNIVEASQ